MEFHGEINIDDPANSHLKVAPFAALTVRDKILRGVNP